jgi:hypothetical protein
VSIKLKIKTVRKVKKVPKEGKKNYSFYTAAHMQKFEQQLQKIEGGFYVPNQRYDSIRRAGQKTPLETITDITRRLHEAVTIEHPYGWNAENAFGRTLRGQEQPKVKDWAIKNKMFFKPDAFNKEFAQHGVEGVEHQVVFQPQRGIVIKRKLLQENETYYDSLQYLDEYNKIFPETPYSFMGFMHGNPKAKEASNKDLMPVYSQPLVQKLTEKAAYNELGVVSKNQVAEMYKQETMMNAGKDKDRQAKLDAANWLLTDKNARTNPTLSEIISFMKGKGFEILPDKSINSSDPDQILTMIHFINRDTGVVLSDLHSGNFIRDVYGDIYCIDPQISLEGKLQSERIYEQMEKLNASTV